MTSLTDAIDTLLHEADLAAAGPWTGPAPLHFTAAYHHPDDLDAARARWVFEYGHFGSYVTSHMWHRAICGGQMRLDEHSLDTFTADLRCPPGAHPRDADTCQCVGGLLSLAICAPCAWHTLGTENETVEAWHDHAFPGWRELPILPDKLRGQMGTRRLTSKLEDWLTDNYPTRFQTPGAPIRTHRQKYGTRHVPDYSPYGGYDLAAAG
tara:strand:+ start:14475 stop:15101 length:627 start_codon:yes stop_codon:yes gene_type:complete